MEQQEDKQVQQIFSDYFLNLDSIQDNAPDLEILIQKYPYCQPLYLLSAKGAENTSSFQQKLHQAAAIIPNRNILYDFIYYTGKFEYAAQSAEPQSENTGKDEETEAVLNVYAQPLPEEELSDESLLEDAENASLITDETGEDESILNAEFCARMIEEAPFVENLENVPGNGNYKLNQQSETDDPRPDATDTHNHKEQYPAESLKSPISVYNDERLPYTFLWWLAKTRKNYENLRPYASFNLEALPKVVQNGPDPLAHQIAENIFHLNTVSGFGDDEPQKNTVAFDFITREHQIIERFIKEEPQIKPPQASKIDTENKAKRSSEDADDMVSETLARIYTEQMLYHKALEVYKKLSLKYPEKSAYFASQIKYLELKVN